MLNFSIGLSSLQANQAGLQIVGNNLANANTPGYHRQDLRLSERDPVQRDGIFFGQGVDVARVSRAYNEATELALTRNISEHAAVDTRLRIAREMESMLVPGRGTVRDQVEQFFNDLQQLTANWDSPAMRSIVIQSASNLAKSINELDQQLDAKMRDLDRVIDQRLDELNGRAAEILDLNVKIRAAQGVAKSPNDLLDRRDQLINDLAQVVDVRVEMGDQPENPNMSGEMSIRLADGQVGLHEEMLKFATVVDGNGQRIVCRVGSPYPVEIHEGELGGLLSARNDLLLGFRNQLKEFTSGLLGAVDNVHATGIGMNGSFNKLIGQRLVDLTTVPLERVETVVPVQAGSLYVNVTDANGDRTLHEVQIDPTVDTLMDVAAKISTIPNLQAIVNDPPGQLSILAAPDVTFDFTGRLPTAVDRTNITGTVVPSIVGQYQGSRNDTLTFTFLGSGTIGVDPGLTLRVTDDAGQLIADLNVGAGYAAGTDLELNNGVRLRLAPGTANAGDEFSALRVQDADTTKILTALGLNTLFTGTPGQDLAVRSDLLSDSDLLATTRSGMPLDSQNTERLLQLRNTSFFSDGSGTFEEYLSDMISAAGVEVEELTHEEDNLATIGHALEAERTAYSGVDPNEQAMRMLEFQRSFQATARFLVVLDEVLQELVNIV